MREDAAAAAPASLTTDDAPAAQDLLRESHRLRGAASAVPVLERDVDALRRELAAIDASLSWRLTSPLRGLRSAVVNRRALALAAGRRMKRRLER